MACHHQRLVLRSGVYYYEHMEVINKLPLIGAYYTGAVALELLQASRVYLPVA